MRGWLAPFGFVLRETEAAGAVGMWETRSVFHGRWAAVGNRRAAPIALAMAVFHRCPPPVISTALRIRSGGASSGAALADTNHELTLGALHGQRRFGVGLRPGEARQLGEGYAGPQVTLAMRHFL